MVMTMLDYILCGLARSAVVHDLLCLYLDLDLECSRAADGSDGRGRNSRIRGYRADGEIAKEGDVGRGRWRRSSQFGEM